MQFRYSKHYFHQLIQKLQMIREIPKLEKSFDLINFS